jgi:hypothetical protein
MSTLRANSVTNVAGTGAPNLPNSLMVGGVALASLNTLEYYAQGTTPGSPKVGAVWWDTSVSKLYYYINGAWDEIVWSALPPPAFAGNRGVFGGGSGPSNVTQYVAIPTPGNTTSFGTLTVARSQLASCAGGGRGVYGGGAGSGGPPTLYTTLDYITFATTGTATAFGALPATRAALAGCGNGTIGVFAGGYNSSFVPTNTISQITIATAANATSFGTLVATVSYLAGAANLTRGVFAGSDNANTTVQFITFATPGNATSSGALATGTYGPAACASTSRAVFAGGGPSNLSTASAYMQYLTIDTLSTAVTFGNLTQARYSPAGTSNGSIGIFGGGQQTSPFSNSVNVIDYITIATPGNATDFGDLLAIRTDMTACSGD